MPGRHGGGSLRAASTGKFRHPPSHNIPVRVFAPPSFIDEIRSIKDTDSGTAQGREPPPIGVPAFGRVGPRGRVAIYSMQEALELPKRYTGSRAFARPPGAFKRIRGSECPAQTRVLAPRGATKRSSDPCRAPGGAGSSDILSPRCSQ
jgi:hypothetical protein